MRHRLWLIPLVITSFIGASVAVAEPLGSHWEVTPFGGLTIFDGKLLFPVSGNPLTDTYLLGGRLAWQSKTWIGIEAAASRTASSEDAPNGHKLDWTHASGNLVLLPAVGRAGGPYVFAGGGWTQIKPSVGATTESPTIEFGGGLRFWLTDAFGFRFEARDVSFKPFVATAASDRLHNRSLGVGLTYAFGAKPRDTDGDGVPDPVDQEPNTPRGALVNRFGVAIDSDGDGVPDGIDRNSNTPRGALVDQFGVPSDSDHDGVYDGIDKCADTPVGVIVDASGCPLDTDGDGVFDGIDKCPDTPKGCAVDSIGCSQDSDGDGICDGLDRCPETAPGLAVDSVGCPVVVYDRYRQIIDAGRFEQHVNFETGKAVLPAESLDSLDVVGQLMLAWPALQVEVGGHTDSRGSAGGNQVLSEKRAQAVRDYLVGKYPGMKDGQLTSKGYGASKSLVPNTSARNMSKNRRVEFVLVNREVLVREVEQRRLLKRGETPPPPPAPTPAPADTARK